MARSEDVKGPLGRLAFANGLFELQTTQSGKKQWNVTILYEKGSDIKVLEEAALKAATEEWGDKAIQWLKDGLIKSPFLDGDGKQGLSKKTGERHAGYAGTKFIRCQSGEEYRPRIFNRKVLPAAKDECYSGCYAYPVVNAYTWDNKEQGKGISFGISMLQIAKDGERLGGAGGGGDPTEYFEKIEDEGDTPDAAKTASGAAGLFG